MEDCYDWFCIEYFGEEEE